jgi:hypothetical protein
LLGIAADDLAATEPGSLADDNGKQRAGHADCSPK